MASLDEETRLSDTSAPLVGHTALVTGRSRGIGRAVALRLAADGAAVAAPPLSLSLTKQGMWLSLDIPSFDAAVELENRQQVVTALTADQREAMSAYRDRRTPVYENR